MGALRILSITFLAALFSVPVFAQETADGTDKDLAKKSANVTNPIKALLLPIPKLAGIFEATGTNEFRNFHEISTGDPTSAQKELFDRFRKMATESHRSETLRSSYIAVRDGNTEQKIGALRMLALNYKTFDQKQSGSLAPLGYRFFLEQVKNTDAQVVQAAIETLIVIPKKPSLIPTFFDDTKKALGLEHLSTLEQEELRKMLYGAKTTKNFDQLLESVLKNTANAELKKKLEEALQQRKKPSHADEKYPAIEGIATIKTVPGSGGNRRPGKTIPSAAQTLKEI